MVKATMVIILTFLIVAVALYSLYTTFEMVGTLEKEEHSREDKKKIIANLKNQILIFITGFLTAVISLW